ncbi:cytochrome P450 [Gigaspora rosea]|uniref:Cytochrome P450 n=1 Tax=Gigaspora rosea TaxID=44941 RepID=A0A397VKH4_9GLOM|nr:cytochrome P450 [Gigaspora rosea]
MDELGIFGRGIFFNSNYDTWKINRYLFSQAISTLGFNNEAIKRTNESFEELVGYWNSLSNSKLSSNDSNSNSSNNNWFEIDFLPWIKKFTSDIISVLATGEHAYSMASYYNKCNSIDSIENSCHDDPTLNYSDKFIQGIITLIKGMIIFQIFNPFLRHHLPLIKDKANNVLENRNFIFKTLDDIIKKRKLEIANNPQKLKSKHDLLTYLLTTNHEDKMSINDEVIRSILLDAFLAGFDTTSNLLCYIIYYICHNPHVKQKMFDEIDSVFPTDISYVTADILAKLKYCEAIIKETSRMMPVTAVSKRVAATKCEVAGYIWPAKTVFHLNYASIHMNEKHWENPNVYDPDRYYLKNDFNEVENDFDVESKKSIHNMDKYSLVIFGGGIRICPGKKFAMISMLSFMALMFRKYDIELVDMQAPLNTYTTFITMCLELKIKIKPRKS